MKWFCVLALLVSLPTGCVANDNQIDALVARLSRPTDDLIPWDNGGVPAITLPRNATPRQVTAACVRAWAFVDGPIKRYKIRAIERVFVPSFPAPGSLCTKYTAVRIRSKAGSKIYLMRYAHDTQWWTRSFDVE